MAARRTSARAFPVLTLAFVVVVGLYLAHALWLGYFGDDAYISFQYVKNLLRGHGLVYNAGERVEGYTNFLWVMVLAGIMAVLRHADIARVSQALGLALGIATMVVLVRLARRHHPEWRWLLLIAPLLMATQSSFTAWSTGGLETTMFAFFVVVAIDAQDREIHAGRGEIRTALMALLIALTRADGFVMVGALGLWRAYESLRRRQPLLGRANLRWAGVFGGGYLAYLLWRHGYYGDWLPNTSYAKVGYTAEQLHRGLSYTRRFWDQCGGPILAAVIGFRWIARQTKPAVRGAFVAASVWTIYVVAIGGDGLALIRFYAFIVPAIALLAQEGVAVIAGCLEPRAGVPRAGRVALLAALVAALAVTGAGQTIDLYRHPNPAAAPYRTGDNFFLAKCRIAGDWLAAHTAPDAVVASNPAGAVAYFSDRRVIDMLGLTDAHIARAPAAAMGTGRAGHEKGDGAYVLGRQPDYILMGNVAVGDDPMVAPEEMERLLRLRSEHELWALPAFHEQYRLMTMPTGAPAPFRYFSFYCRTGSGCSSVPGS